MGIASLLLVAIVLLFSCQDAYALKCYKCNTLEDPCPSTFDGTTNKHLEVECGSSSKYCVTSFLFGETRYCSTPSDENQLCSTLEAAPEKYWCCETDLCNTGATLVSGLPVLIVTLTWIIYVAMNHFV